METGCGNTLDVLNFFRRQRALLTDDELAQRGWDYNIVLRHEIGHCNGWHHD